MAEAKLPELNYDKLQIGEELGTYEYLLTQEILDSFRATVEDTEYITGATLITVMIKSSS